MFRHSRIAVFTVTSTLMFLILRCGGGGGENVVVSPSYNLFEDYSLDPEIYVLDPNPDRIIEAVRDDGMSVRFPVDQLVLLMFNDTPREDAERVAMEVGGRIVGQVPDIDFYQIELPTTTREELDRALARVLVDQSVEDAGYNIETRFVQKCPADNDNELLVDADRCTFANTEYYQTITMFDEFRSHLTLHPVTIGVIESGVEAVNGEFDDLILLNINHPGALLRDTDPDGHGTRVVGIIGADDDKSGVNGIASRFLRENLRVAVGAGEYVAAPVAAARRAIQAHARVINLSLGYTTASLSENYVKSIWERLIREHPEVLFVIAAGNDGVEVTTNEAPAGIRLPNVITVASSEHCDPNMLASFSNFGPLVDIIAPGENVTVVGKRDGHVVEVVSGNSYAAPQVTALAAILFSLDPQLTPREVRENYIIGQALFMSGYEGNRVTFTRPIEQLLIDLSLGPPITDWIDPLGLGSCGSTGAVLSRICRGITYSVAGYGTHQISGQESSVANGLIGSNNFTLAASTENALLAINVTSTFELGTYQVDDNALPETAYVVFTDLASLDAGQGTSGELTLESCRIDERSPITNDPSLINVSGIFGGAIEIIQVTPPERLNSVFEGYFNLTFVVANVPLGDPVFQYMEENCEGGIPTS